MHHSALHGFGPLDLALCAATTSGAVIYSAITLDMNVAAIVGGIATVTAAAVTALKVLMPQVAEAIRTVGPALAELQKQREEIHRGPLTRQIEELNATVKATQERVEDANKKLHDARNQANRAELLHQEELQSLKSDLEAARSEIAKLREENLRLTQMAIEWAEKANRRAEVNAENIDLLSRSAEFPAVKPAAPPPPPPPPAAPQSP